MRSMLFPARWHSRLQSRLMESYLCLVLLSALQLSCYNV